MNRIPLDALPEHLVRLVDMAEKYTVEEWKPYTELWLESTAAAVLFVKRSPELERAKIVADASALGDYIKRIDRLRTENYEAQFFVALIHLSDAALARLWLAIDGKNRPELAELLLKTCDA